VTNVRLFFNDRFLYSQSFICGHCKLSSLYCRSTGISQL